MALDRYVDRGRPVCVLGIGRSGTSLAAKVIDVLGVDLGPEETMLPPDEFNPKGYWEQREVVELNNEILAALGGSWWQPPRRPRGWEAAPEMDPFRERIEELVARWFSGRRWGFKDPRTTLTLPLWRSVVGELDHVICLRNPIEVEASMGSHLPRGADLMAIWLHYGCEALRQTAGRQRTFVFYEQWATDPLAVAHDLAEFVNGAVDAVALERVASIFDSGLRRQKASDRELAERHEIPIEARMLPALARKLAGAEARGETARARALQVRASSLDETQTAGAAVR